MLYRALPLLLKQEDINKIRMSEGRKTSFPPEHWYYIVQLVGKKGEVAGYGIAAKKHLALTKAFMEADERYALLGTTRYYGAAAHFIQNMCSKTAFYEAIERDSLIRWCLGFTGHSTIERSDKHVAIVLGVTSAQVVIVANLDRKCIPFGIAASPTVVESYIKAREELGLSLVRHEARCCATDQSVYGLLHQNTRNPEFRYRLLNSNNLNSNNKSETYVGLSPSYKELGGCHRWPIRVVAYNDKSLFKWDQRWMLALTSTRHPNTAIAAMLKQTEKRIPFVTG